MDSILYLIFIFLGFIGLFVSSIYINKKYKIMSIEYLMYNHIFFLVGFLFLAKIFHIILDFDYNINITSSIIELFKFLSSGYTFIGGIIGGILAIFLFSKVIRITYNNIFLLFVPSMLLMYSLMKIGCYFKGCCIGINGFNIQLIESILNMIGYLLIMKLFNDKKVIIYSSFITFGLLRFVISFFRIYPNKFSFWFIQIFCILLIIIGIYGLNNRKYSKKIEKLCKKG